jgi:hypothetical protein
VRVCEHLGHCLSVSTSLEVPGSLYNEEKTCAVAKHDLTHGEPDMLTSERTFTKLHVSK